MPEYRVEVRFWADDDIHAMRIGDELADALDPWTETVPGKGRPCVWDEPQRVEGESQMDKEMAMRAANHACCEAVMAGATKGELLAMVEGVTQTAAAWGYPRRSREDST